MAEDKASIRVLLPPNVEPKSYEVSIVPDLEAFTFTGSEVVEVVVVSPTSVVQLHARDLYVSSASFKDSAGKVSEAVEISTHLTDKVVSIKFSEDLCTGAGTLTIAFAGEINNQMAGFYRSQYVNAKGEKKWMGSTQFEALDARRAFPCWDEPSRKATFTLKLTIDENSTALSNMPESSNVITAGGKRVVSFLPTPKMSTYLLCWCIGEFDSVSALTKNGVLCKVYAPPGRGESGRFALDVAVRTLDLYDDFFMVPYPLPKLDMIAIMDFAMGAMENWGLVTYREADLLIDEETASSQQRQRVAAVVAHELAHQWFGNLVTMAWWDDLWLNEGFASWTQTFACDTLFPEWGMWTQFISDDQATAMRLDAMRSSHPIQVPIGRAEEVEEVFDAISYCKGASVIRMLHAVLGAEDFQKGLQIYMERHQYGNTETFHLWRAWEEASGKPIADIMSSWTTQMGFPLLEVLSQNSDLYGATTMEVKQTWFLADGSEPDARNWTVPLTVATNETKISEYTSITFEKETLFKVHVPPASDGKHPSWIKLNAGQHAPLRVVYSDYAPLIAAVKAGQLSPEDRAGLLLDAYALAKAGHPGMTPVKLVELVKAYEGEQHATVWEALEMILCGLDKLLVAAGSEQAALRTKFVAFAAGLIMPVAASVGWESRADDGHLGKLKRATLVRLQAHFCASDEAVVAKARELWDKELNPENKENALPSDFKTPVFKIVLSSASTSAEFDALMAHYDTLTSSADRKQVYLAIGAAASVSLKRKVLEWAISGSIKLQDFFYPIGSVSGSGQDGLDLAWSFFQDNYDGIRALVAGAHPFMMDAAIVYSISGFATNAKADEIDAYFTNADGKPKLPSCNRKIKQTVEAIRTNAAFLKRILDCNLNSALN